MAIAWRTFSLSNGGERVVEAEVHDVQAFADLQLQVRIGLHRLEVGATDVVDAIDRTGLELDQPLCGLGAPADDQLLRLGLVTPVVVEPGEGHVRALVPGVELVRARAVDLVHDRLVRRPGRVDVRRDPSGIVDPE